MGHCVRKLIELERSETSWTLLIYTLYMPSPQFTSAHMRIDLLLSPNYSFNSDLCSVHSRSLPSFAAVPFATLTLMAGLSLAVAASLLNKTAA